jgi:hypothetical protein
MMPTLFILKLLFRVGIRYPRMKTKKPRAEVLNRLRVATERDDRSHGASARHQYVPILRSNISDDEAEDGSAISSTRT